MGIALSGGVNVWTEFDGSTRAKFISGLATTLIRAGWELDDTVKASIVHTYDATVNVLNGAAISIGGLVYTWKNTINNATPRDVKRGATLQDSLDNLEQALAADPVGTGTLYSTATIIHPTIRLFTTTPTVGVIEATLVAKIGGPFGNGLGSTYGTLKGGGYKLIGHSPQTKASDSMTPLQVKGYVYDNLDNTLGGTILQARVDLSSPADDLIVTSKKIKVVAGRKYRCVANRCQFFCYVEGVSSDPYGSVVTGGIPWVPASSDCSGERVGGIVDEIWWHSADNGLSACATPRTVLAHRVHISQVDPEALAPNETTQLSDAAGLWFNSSGSVNGVVTEAAGTSHGAMRMVSMTPSENWPNALTGGADIIGSVMWADGKPLTLEPIVAWGSPTSADDPQVRGQIFDAVIRTYQENAATDIVREFDGRKWLAFTDKYKFGTLWLIVPDLKPLGMNVRSSYAY